ncbi:SGNH/GDSL hydrolase family protein [Variovorax sp. J22P271]|uniref:SGNH/GDSL hydrolase family protein n=1 Tax=Variovorax davisae TaxID=3053515 RepID=UPI002576F733|nr:SGNH/GDSL hydrolase family protein [Variovorax sp. J22P271]MDM0037280.1 SGNH/GDSL hydrolase family protein [Variovorax sp. J22P271]
MTGPAPSAAGAISLAVLGDSGGHSYQDSLVFVAPHDRGGAFRPLTFQWTEVLARLRPDEIDLGPWVRWGSRNRVARLRECLGLSGQRVPRKEDYLYNFAVTGAACEHLMGNRIRQAPRLVALMNQQPERWRGGVVVIRVGSNDFTSQVELAARDPSAPALGAVTAHCAREIARAVALIHAAHPSVRIVLVGVAGEADDPLYVDRWQSAEETANFKASLDQFNGAIRRLAAGDSRIAFADISAWLAARVGSRTAAGKPDYRTIAIGPRIRVTHSVGDDPRNSVLADDHSGVAMNALWAQSLVQQLIDDFGLPLTPIGDEEVIGFLEPLFESATAPGS